MKWVRRIVMIILALGIAGSGFMAFQAFTPWRDAAKKTAEVEAETFDGEDIDYSFSTQENQNSVAFIGCISPDRNYIAYGSSYAIGDPDEKVQYFVTNGHVISSHMNDGYDINVYFDTEDKVTPEVVFYQFDADLDMAILKIPEPTDKRSAVVIRDSSEVQQGEECVAIGYPAKSNEMDTTFSMKISDQTVTKGVIGKTDVVPQQQTYTAFQHDSFISNGNSGGPLFDENGFFIGMNTLVRTDSENVNFSIVSNEVTAILDQYGIDYTNSKDYIEVFDDEAEKAKKAFEKDHKKDVSEAQDEEVAERNKFILWAGIAAGCAVVLLIVAIVGNKKVIMVGEQDDGKKSYLICTKGMYMCQKYEITGQTMTIGRDQNSCTILFPEDAPGISSNHCSIYYDARTKAFVLTDNGSTYGTYLSDGRKLTKGVPEKLLPGASFALADKANEFKVDRE